MAMNHNIAISRATAPLFQFGLRALLAATTLVCLTAAAWRAFGGAAVIVLLTALMICLGGYDRRGIAYGYGYEPD